MAALSDNVSAVGSVILMASWNGSRITDRYSTTTFARQLQPTSYQRGLWRRLVWSYLVQSSGSPVAASPGSMADSCVQYDMGCDDVEGDSDPQRGSQGGSPIFDIWLRPLMACLRLARFTMQHQTGMLLPLLVGWL